MTDREQWLSRLADLLRPRFAEAGLELPGYRVAVRHPDPDPAVWGLCRFAAREIVISPVLGQDDAANVLTHELVHSALTDGGHGPAFGEGCRAVGLAPHFGWFKTAVTPELRRYLGLLVAQLGRYPEPPQSWFTAGGLTGSRARALIMRRRGEPG
jgi:hypothetical protein